VADQRQTDKPTAPQPNHWRHVLRRANDHMLFAEDIGPKGSSVAVEIVESGVGSVKTRSGSEAMPWVGFKGKKKKLGLNRTNCKTLETLCGTPDYMKWRGWVTLVVIRTRAPDRDSGEMIETDAIRIGTQRPASGGGGGAGGGRNDRARSAAQDSNGPDAEEHAEINRRDAQDGTR